MTTRNPIDDRSPEIVGSLAGLPPSSASTAFTPGPWEAVFWNNHPTVQGLRWVEITPADWPIVREFMKEADGRLIAAAPELYEMLELAVGVINAAGIIWMGVDKAEAVLAKARGQ